ncbi:hypothetical protein RRG08_009189 [Elysia crispata]|uniref:Uncharacterized protein n=1 Tax=Elysia crispata TaxID=231223 RepID=A0AAE0ZP60_9GAST|nr:hypothetical protein RRG08_009189 [Elysia crispata]
MLAFNLLASAQAGQQKSSTLLAGYAETRAPSRLSNRINDLSQYTRTARSPRGRNLSGSDSTDVNLVFG